ncbi:MAG: DUF2505 family protein [Deltaproteobacteria bacterium]|nr:DUF2505 family protein [Deltaproteobacteria bacterium]
MREVVVESLFHNVSVEGFAEVYFSEEVNEEAAKCLGLKERKLVEKVENEDGTIGRRVKMSLSLQLPKAIQKILSGAPIEYFEVSTYDPKDQRIEYRVESAADDVVKVSGTITFIKTGTGVVRRIDGTVEVKIFGVGGLIERFIDKEVGKAYAKVAVVMQAAIDDKHS